eukprot:757578-Pelagomonas_calceolata.AAC.3
MHERIYNIQVDMLNFAQDAVDGKGKRHLHMHVCRPWVSAHAFMHALQLVTRPQGLQLQKLAAVDICYGKRGLG